MVETTGFYVPQAIEIRQGVDAWSQLQDNAMEGSPTFEDRPIAGMSKAPRAIGFFHTFDNPCEHPVIGTWWEWQTLEFGQSTIGD